MSLLYLIAVLIVVGVFLYVVQLLPMDALVKRVVQILVLLVFALWLLDALGFLAGAPVLRLR